MRHFNKSFKHAIIGLNKVYREERNMKVHSVFGIASVLLGYILGLSWVEWLFLASAITFVFVAEIVNTIFERFIDMAKPTVNDYVRDMKDMMAASVLVASFYALVVGIVIFLPKVVQVVSSIIVALSEK